MVETVRGICERLGDVSDEGKARLVEAHAQACNTPKYIRAAIKALRKLLEQKDPAPYLPAMNIAGAALMPAEPVQTWQSAVAVEREVDLDDDRGAAAQRVGVD